jgi:ATP-dependent DNA helicase RecG
MISFIEKYTRILKLEASQGYENRAVMGGMARLVDAFTADAREDGLDEVQLSTSVKLLKGYADFHPIARRDALQELVGLIGAKGLGVLPAVPKGQNLAITPEEVARSKQDKLIVETPKKTSTRKVKPVESAGEAQKKPRKPKLQSPPEAIARHLASDESQGLDASVDVIRGVGEKQARILEKLGIHKIKDLLYHFPRRYDDYSKLKSISGLRFGEEVTVAAYVVESRLVPTKRGRKIIEAVVSDTTGMLRLLWFNQEFQLRYLKKGLLLSISGKVEAYMGRPVMFHPDYEAIDKQQLNTNRIVPVYPLTALVTQRWMRKTIFNTLDYWAPRVTEFLPDLVLDQADLIGLQEGLRQVHFPDSFEALKAAQQRFAFDELFMLQLGIINQKRQWQALEGTPYPVTNDWVEQRRKALPYELTNAQSRTLTEMRADISSPHPMNRLLQGDVGSGKTVVAMLGMAMVIEHGPQAALMAPTSILAEQHFRTLRQLMTEPANGVPAFLEPGQVRLLTGDTSKTDRKEILAGLQSGYIKCLIGTHALIEDPVAFYNLQMVVVDEQHRFGVEQRAALRNKGFNPHLLVMTATPIPRSLQLTVFGDLDVSVMDEMPKGRLPIKTIIAFPGERASVYERVRREVAKGQQVFIIYPLVEQGESEETKAAVEEQQRLQADIFPELRVGLVHGRLKPAEKDAVMLRFRERAYDILVSTSVVEVGVDIPNATMMVVEGANRFGLAQLHQFRGRVGRGEVQSLCVLIPETEDAAENERLLVMTQTNDGFVLAEKDLQQRGPGDFLGTRQAGFTDLRMANLADIRLIAKARRIAEEVYERDPYLSQPENRLLRQAIYQFWPTLGGTGDMS